MATSTEATGSSAVVDQAEDDRHLVLMWTTAPETFLARHWLVLHTYLHHHPGLRVQVYASHLPLDFFAPLSRWGYRIEVVRIDDTLLAELADACPGRRWMDRLSDWRQGPYFYSHLTDYLRFCLLARTGGIYSDFDALLLQPLDPATPVFIGKDASHAVRDAAACPWCLEDGHYYLAPGVMAVRARSPLLLEALRLAFDGDYLPHVFNAVGPQAVTAAYKSLRYAYGGNAGTPDDGLVVYEPDMLYPLPYWRAHESLLAAPLVATAGDADDAPVGPASGDVRLTRLARQSLSLHLFGHMTGRLPIEAGSVVDHAASRFRVVDPAADAAAYTLRGPAYVALTGAASTPMRAWRLVPGEGTSAEQLVQVEATSAVVHLAAAGAEPRDGSTVAASGPTPLTLAAANLWLAGLTIAAPAGPRAGAWDGRDRVELRVWPAGSGAAPSTSPLAEQTVEVYDLSRLVTVIVKTTGRIAKVFELLRSVRARYPTLKVIAADDGAHTAPARTLAGDPHFEFVPLPFDVGLSAGRNAMVDRVDTPLVLTLDDDFTLDANSVIEELVHAVAAGHADVAAGRNPVDEARYQFEFCGLLEVNGSTLEVRAGHRGRAGACQRVDIVPNLFVARTAALRALRWDPALKLGEHEDFFLRARQARWIVATCPTVSFVHEGSTSWFVLTDKSSTYDRMRSRIHQFWEAALRKHGLKRLVSFGTVVIDLDGPAPVAEVMAGEVLPSALTVYWTPSRWATKYELAISRAGSGVPAVVRQYDVGPVLIIDLEPATVYIVTVFALIAHVRDAAGRTITARTRPALAGSGLLRNGGFEAGGDHWTPAFGTNFHTSRDHVLHGRLSGRLQVHASAYLSPTPAIMRIEQRIPVVAAARRFVVAAWSSIENLFGDAASITYRLEATAHCDGGERVTEHADFALNVQGWQFRSFSLELAPDVHVAAVTVRCILAGHRGAVYFDNVTVVDEL